MPDTELSQFGIANAFAPLPGFRALGSASRSGQNHGQASAIIGFLPKYALLKNTLAIISQGPYSLGQIMPAGRRQSNPVKPGKTTPFMNYFDGPFARLNHRDHPNLELWN